MKRLRQAIRSYSGLLLAGAVLLQVNFLPAQSVPIAVVEFEGNGISQTEAIALTDRLRNELFRLGTFEVVERGMMESILAEQDFQMAGCTSNECLVQVGRLLGAKQVVGGSISKVGTMFTVSARVVDVEAGKVIQVSDYDLEGSINQLLTSGMKAVAMLLASGEEMVTPKTVKSITVPRRVETGQIPSVKKVAKLPKVEKPFRAQVFYGIAYDDGITFKDRSSLSSISYELTPEVLLNNNGLRLYGSLDLLSRTKNDHDRVEKDDYYENERVYCGMISLARQWRSENKYFGAAIFSGIGVGYYDYYYRYSDYYEGSLIDYGKVEDNGTAWVSSVGGQVSAWSYLVDARYIHTPNFGSSLLLSVGGQQQISTKEVIISLVIVSVILGIFYLFIF